MDTVASVFDPFHTSRFLETFHSFFINQTMTDICFICKNAQKVRAHGMVLSAVSKQLKKIFLELAGNNQEIVIHLPDVTASSLKLVLFFLYEGATRLDGVAEYEEFQSVLKLLGIEPDNSGKAPAPPVALAPPVAPAPPVTPVATAQGKDTKEPPLMREPFANLHGGISQNSGIPPISNQMPSSYVGQSGMPNSQPQVSSYKILPNPSERILSEPAHRKSTDTKGISGRAAGPAMDYQQPSFMNAASTPRPQKRKNLETLPPSPNVAVSGSQLGGTTNFVPYHHTNPNLPSNSSNIRGNCSNLRNVRGPRNHSIRSRGRPRLSSYQRSPSRQPTETTYDCVIVDD